MAWRGGGVGRVREAFRGSVLPRLDALKDSLGRAGFLRVFLLGLAIGVAIGILGGRLAERFRLKDYVAIEQMILDGERLPKPRPLVLPPVPFPAEPSRM